MSRGWITEDASMTNMQHYVVVQNSFDVAFEGKNTILACKEKISPFLFAALFVIIIILFIYFPLLKLFLLVISLNWTGTYFLIFNINQFLLSKHTILNFILSQHNVVRKKSWTRKSFTLTDHLLPCLDPSLLDHVFTGESILITGGVWSDDLTERFPISRLSLLSCFSSPQTRQHLLSYRNTQNILPFNQTTILPSSWVVACLQSNSLRVPLLPE